MFYKHTVILSLFLTIVLEVKKNVLLELYLNLSC